MDTTWLPREALQRRRQLQRVLLNRGKKSQIFRLSEFLTVPHVLFFDGHQSKIEAVEALVGTLTQQDPRAALQAIWDRERQGALIIPPDVAILRGRLDGTHYMRAALGLCTKGIANPSNAYTKTRVLVVLIGPVDQTHLHMNLLTSVSALFWNRRLTENLLRSGSATEILRMLQKAEGVNCAPNSVHRVFQNVRAFVNRHYGWGGDEEIS